MAGRSRGDLGETLSMFISEHYASNPRACSSPPFQFSTACKRGLTNVAVHRSRCEHLSEGTWKIWQPSLGRTLRFNCSAWPANPVARLNNEQRTRAKTLGMTQLDHIVCFDMAQLQGDERVGASVVMRNGRPAKKEYRKYIVKGEALDDLRMMKEVVVRWAKRQEEWPDLLLIDGGNTPQHD